MIYTTYFVYKWYNFVYYTYIICKNGLKFSKFTYRKLIKN